ncbi:MAG: CD1247 N-terminal domain-containing protein [Oscillospiraceae bacterium]
MTIGEKVSYIKGLAEGLSLDGTTKEGKIIAAMLDVLSDIAENLSEVDDELNDIADVMTDMEESVADLEDIVYDIDDEDDDEYDDEDDFDDDLDELYTITCPACSNTIRFDYEQAAKGGMDCPNCGAHLDFEPEDDDAE